MACGLGLAQPQPHRAHELGEQLLLGREVPVEEALGDAGAAADVLDARRRVAVGGEQLGGGVDELLLALAAVLGVPAVASARRARPSRRSGGRLRPRASAAVMGRVHYDLTGGSSRAATARLATPGRRLR